MMALASMESPGLVVLPSHRLATANGDFDPDAFRASLSERFDLEEVASADAVARLDEATGPAVVVRTPADGRLALARLRRDAEFPAPVRDRHSAAWLSLDVAVVQELVLGPALGIHPDRPETMERLAFAKEEREALETAGPDVVVLVRPTGVTQLREVALTGETMPQKSTYFYPKLLSGLLFRSLD